MYVFLFGLGRVLMCQGVSRTPHRGPQRENVWVCGSTRRAERTCIHPCLPPPHPIARSLPPSRPCPCPPACPCSGPWRSPGTCSFPPLAATPASRAQTCACLRAAPPRASGQNSQPWTRTTHWTMKTKGKLQRCGQEPASSRGSIRRWWLRVGKMREGKGLKECGWVGGCFCAWTRVSVLGRMAHA